MKTLVRNKVSLMIIKDDVPIKMGEVIEVDNRYRIDNKDGSIILYENVTPPTNYRGNFFCFDGKSWSQNLNWRPSKKIPIKVDR